MAREREAYAERRATGLRKPIERAKLEERVRQFVRESVKRLHAAR
jgi:hypothetical protein